MRLAAAYFLWAFCLSSMACRKARPDPPNPVIAMTVHGQTLKAEVVSTEEKRAVGLMFRTDLPTDEGMLFVYPTAQSLAFWMKNTYIPLSVAFLDAEGTVLNIRDMATFDETPGKYTSAGAAKYGLEMNYGWFQLHNVGPGDRLVFSLPPGLAID
jgi:uncharacterized protein